MSHFACLVITPTKPDHDELSRILQPWHEYECTGVRDQYVVEVDVTDQVVEEFNKPQQVVIEGVLGNQIPRVWSRWDDRFYIKEPIEKPLFGSSRKEFELPAGAELKAMPADEARTHGIGYKTLAECAKEYFGEVIERNGKFYDLTNPNKWVWIDATGKEVGRTTGDETLPQMQPGPTPGSFSFNQTNEIKPSGEIHLLPGMRQGTGTTEDAPTEVEGVPKLQVPNDSGTIPRNIGSSKESVRNLQATPAPLTGKDESNSPGSLSLDGENTRNPVSGVQQNAGAREGQPPNTEGSDSISYPVRKYLVSGTKWDWWQVGGRWTGLLVPNYDPDKDPDNIETCKLCGGTGIRLDWPTHSILDGGGFAKEIELSAQVKRGTRYDPNNETHKELKCNGCNGEGKHAVWATSRKRIEGDQMKVADIPLVALRNEAERRALEQYDKAHAIIAGRPIPIWDPVEGQDIEAARKEYWDNPVIKDLQKADFWMLDGVEQFAKSRNQVAVEARANAICTFAVVKDGKWYERGEMGWWAIVSKAKEKEVWTSEFAKMIDGLPPDYWISVIDCHI